MAKRAFAVLTASGQFQPEMYKNQKDALREALTFSEQGGAGVVTVMLPEGNENDPETEDNDSAQNEKS